MSEIRGMGRLTESSLVNVKNVSFAFTAEIASTDRPVEDVMLAQGGSFDGRSLYPKHGRAKFAYNLCTWRSHGSRPIGRCHLGHDRSAWNSPRTAASVMAAPSRCTTTATAW
ncbi:hypothetical protein [Streptomyces sp. NPDC002463]|uniref:hypothetical protein n=1 Tax=Streptomyces sp. NPDC002463 TaxID=3364645 RepID=UPI0036CB2471